MEIKKSRKAEKKIFYNLFGSKYENEIKVCPFHDPSNPVVFMDI